MAEVNTADKNMMAALGQHWGLVMCFGILSVVLGGMLVATPVTSTLSIMLLIGIWVFVSGIFRIVQAFGQEGEGHRVWWIVLGLLGLVVGIFLIRHPIQASLVVAMVIGIFWFAQGLFELFAGISDADMPNRGLTIFMGIIGVIAGSILMFSPYDIVLLVWVSGIWLIVYGIMTFIASFSLKKAAAAG